MLLLLYYYCKVCNYIIYYTYVIYQHTPPYPKYVISLIHLNKVEYIHQHHPILHSFRFVICELRSFLCLPLTWLVKGAVTDPTEILVGIEIRITIVGFRPMYTTFLVLHKTHNLLYIDLFLYHKNKSLEDKKNYDIYSPTNFQ